jgi:hypothetical protein
MLYSFYRYIVVLPLFMEGRARGGNAEPVVRYALASDCLPASRANGSKLVEMFYHTLSLSSSKGIKQIFNPELIPYTKNAPREGGASDG